MSHVLITGAAGRLGRVLLGPAAEAGWTITALVPPARDGQPERPLPHVQRTVVGNAADPAVAADAVAGVDAVIHLAAIPSPTLAPPHVVFGQNTLATFCVLDAAADAGVSRAVIASSLSAYGLSFSPYDATPAYLPLDESTPPQAADPYALGKLTDELTAAAVTRRSGMATTCLRLPFLGGPDDRLGERAELLARTPVRGRQEMWTYLDVRDAARAVLCALDRDGGGTLTALLAAPEILAPYPTDDLLDAFLPGVERRRRFPGRSVPFDLAVATDVLGFTAQHLWPVEPRALTDDVIARTHEEDTDA